MGHHKIPKLLNNSTVSKFVARKWAEVSDLSGSQYSINKNIRFKTRIERSDLCDYSGAYIVVKGTMTVKSTATADANERNKRLTFKNNDPFRSCL